MESVIKAELAVPITVSVSDLIALDDGEEIAADKVRSAPIARGIAAGQNVIDVERIEVAEREARLP